MDKNPWDSPHLCLHENWYCHGSYLLWAAMLLGFHGCTFPVIYRRYYLTRDILVLWLLVIWALGVGVLCCRYINWVVPPTVSWSLRFDHLWIAIILLLQKAASLVADGSSAYQWIQVFRKQLRIIMIWENGSNKFSSRVHDLTSHG